MGEGRRCFFNGFPVYSTRVGSTEVGSTKSFRLTVGSPSADSSTDVCSISPRVRRANPN